MAASEFGEFGSTLPNCEVTLLGPNGLEIHQALGTLLRAARMTCASKKEAVFTTKS